MATAGPADAPARVYLALGTNRGDRAAHLRGALAGLSALLDVDGVSAVYETAPFGVLDQPDFWNMAVAGRTGLAPEPLLDALQSLERAVGRVASFRLGPREIDIDMLLHGDIALAGPRLTLPHPGLMERPFVLRPLVDVAPDLRHPVTGERIADRLHALGDAGIRRLGEAAQVLEGRAVR